MGPFVLIANLFAKKAFVKRQCKPLIHQHSRARQKSPPIHITLSYAALLLSSTSAILLISLQKGHTSLGFSSAQTMCDTHEGSSRTQRELQSSARSQSESATVCYCLHKRPEPQPGGEYRP